MPNNHASLTAEEILTETRRMIDSKRWRSTATALNAYREFIDTAMPRMMDIVEQQREQIAVLMKERPMWLNAIKIALSGEVALIGEPGKPNVVRVALEPVDLLMKERDVLTHALESIAAGGFWGTTNDATDLVKILDEHKRLADSALEASCQK